MNTPIHRTHSSGERATAFLPLYADVPFSHQYVSFAFNVVSAVVTQLADPSTSSVCLEITIVTLNESRNDLVS